MTATPPTTTDTEIVTTEFITGTTDTKVMTMTPTPLTTTATEIMTTEFTTEMTDTTVMTMTPTPLMTSTATEIVTTEFATETINTTVTTMTATPPMMTTATEIVTTEFATLTTYTIVMTITPTPPMTTTASEIVATESATEMTETIVMTMAPVTTTTPAHVTVTLKYMPDPTETTAMTMTTLTVTTYSANSVTPTINETMTTTVTVTPEIRVEKEHNDLAWCKLSFQTLDKVLRCDYMNTVIKPNKFMIGLGKMTQPYDNVTDIDPLNEDEYMYMGNDMTHIEGHPTAKVLQCNFQQAEICINKDVCLWDVIIRKLGSYIIEEEVMDLGDKKVQLPHTCTLDSVHGVRVAEHIMCKFRKKNVVIPDIHSVTHSLMARVSQPRLRCSQQIYHEYYVPKMRYDKRVISLHSDPLRTKPPVVMLDNVYCEIVSEDGILKSLSREEIEEEVDEEVITEEITRMRDVFCCKMTVSRVSPSGLIRESHFPCWSFINPFSKDPSIKKKGDDVFTNYNGLECKWKRTIVRIDRSS